MTTSLARAPLQLDIVADTVLRDDTRYSSSVAVTRHLPGIRQTCGDDESTRYSSSVHASVADLNRRRLAAGLTHDQLVQRAGVSSCTWRDLRRGTKPSAMTLKKLEAALEGPREAKPPQIIKAFHRLVMQLIAQRMDFDVATLLATDFSKQRPGLPLWLRAARIRQMAIYITAVELEVSNADLGRALGDTRANIKYARDAIEQRREDGNEIDAVLTAVTDQVRA